MIKKLFVAAISLCVGINGATQTINIMTAFNEAAKQTDLMLTEVQKAAANHPELVSPRTLDHGELKLVKSEDWTSGFFPGTLWYLFEYNKQPKWEEEARAFTAKIEKEKQNGTTHDMGFKIYCSFGNGYRLTKDARYKDIIVESAKTLSKRFNPVAGVIRSWDHSKQKWDYPVIIDNMLNLELLFEAAKLTGNKTFYQIAVSHANKTLQNHFRADYSSFHVVDYDSTTGTVIKKTTHQGYANESAWARGQAWGLYGYTMCYRETGDPRYLELAENIAGYILKHPNLPKDLVPYWDFNAPQIPQEPRDASAAAIIASGLLELSTYSRNSKKTNFYKLQATTILENLTRYYRAPIGQDKGFILLHSTGSKPSGSEVDAPLSYADYYYLEGLLRLKKLKEQKKLF